jgi:hypothetical protein
VSSQRSHAELEHVVTFTALTGKAMTIPGAPQGTRGIIPVTGGTFEGPRLSGTLVPPGGDWFTVRANGTLKLDVRALLVTDDGVNILISYSGVAIPQETGGMRIRIAPLFEAPDGPYAWLNDVQCVGYGDLVDGGVRYEVYSLS